MVNRDKCPPCGISWPWLCPTSSFHVGWLWAWPTGKLTYSGTGLFQTKPLASYFQMITPNAIGWIFMSSKHSSVEILTFVVMDLRSGAFGRWRFSCMVMRGESSWTSLVPLWKRPQRASSPSYHVRTQQDDNRLWTRKQALARHWIYRYFGLERPSFQSCEKHNSVV